MMADNTLFEPWDDGGNDKPLGQWTRKVKAAKAAHASERDKVGTWTRRRQSVERWYRKTVDSDA